MTGRVASTESISTDVSVTLRDNSNSLHPIAYATARSQAQTLTT